MTIHTCVAMPCKNAPNTEIVPGMEAWVPIPRSGEQEARHLACRLQPGSWSRVLDLEHASVAELGGLKEDDYVYAEGRHHRLTNVSVDRSGEVVVGVTAFSVSVQQPLHLVTYGRKVMTPSDPALRA